MTAVVGSWGASLSLRRIVVLLAALCGGLGVGPGHAQVGEPMEPGRQVGELTPRAAANESALLSLLNDFRKSAGLAPWRVDPGLRAIATSHAEALVQQGRLSHDGFHQRVRLTGSHRCVENLAAGAAPPSALLHAWQQSPEHLSNLLDPGVAWVGVGQAGRYWVLMACATAARPGSSGR